MSLYQLLPAASAALDLFDPDSWPRLGARPDPALLRAARGFAGRLAPPDARFLSIVGTGQRTVTGIERRGQQFRYQVSSAGDGTVDSRRASLPGVRSYSLRCEHSELPRSEAVAAALIDLLRRGATRRLRSGLIARYGRSSYVTDAEPAPRARPQARLAPPEHRTSGALSESPERIPGGLPSALAEPAVNNCKMAMQN